MINPTVTRDEFGRWSFSWPDTHSAGYDVYYRGELLATVVTPSYLFSLPGYDTAPPEIEVVETATAAQTATYPSRNRLQWYGDPNAAAYVVEEYVGGVWTYRATVYESESGYYFWTSDEQNDDEESQYRVTPVGLNGASGPAINFTTHCVRLPAAPAVSFSINSSGDVVVSAA